ncbi:MAG: membrane dipeptidase [Gracilibacteraceae bacterium]|nr:membrane dipeptidase [Gracilibacteraceae bacterium]
MKLIDLHCDTILSCINSNGEVKLEKNNLCIDIKKLKKADSLAQFFAMYVDLKKYSAPMDRCLDMIDCFYNEIEENSADIAFAGSTKELKKNKSEGKISAFLTVEEGGVLEGKLRNLRILYKLGVRLITLTWNYPNCIGYPNFRWEHKDKGLTAFGEEVVAEMNRLGMIIDVSHLSDQGFYDVAELSGKPFIASHSNARAVTNHWRNLTDDMLRKLAEKGGVAGLNLEPEFLGEVGSVEAMTRHVIHMINAAGIEAVAIGTDFDGCSLLTAIKDAGDMHKLWDALSKAGLSGRDMDKIMHKNVERVIRDVMG